MVVVSKQIKSLTNLVVLSLDNNQLSELPEEIGNLTNLKGLQINNNNITKLPKEIGNLNNLTKLSLSNNELIEITKEIGRLTELSWLRLDENKLTKLPKEIGNLTALYSLNIVKYPAQKEELARLIKLDVDEPLSIIQYDYTFESKEINFRKRKLTELPHDILNMKTLDSMDISDNQLTNIPLY
ncbi:L domain-like protein [Piromyces finnis]|uniref:L domain-like protein n=1 Tax=Piromyces finnis TaxID=1754191 RepID=A0A1Y1UZ38_9FUNG|nr:L domain-like protein [Piromyces finnis]|eukprot:ORX43893.1 L domain-like protein [Piromyces finnis]